MQEGYLVPVLPTQLSKYRQSEVKMCFGQVTEDLNVRKAQVNLDLRSSCVPVNAT
jgi:hypothetical protein